MILFALILIGTIVFAWKSTTLDTADKLSLVIMFGTIINLCVTPLASNIFSDKIQTNSELFSYEKGSKEFVVGWNGENYIFRDRLDNIYVSKLKDYITCEADVEGTICKLEQNTTDSYLYPFLFDVGIPNDNITLPANYKVVSVQKEVTYKTKENKCQK